MNIVLRIVLIVTTFVIVGCKGEQITADDLRILEKMTCIRALPKAVHRTPTWRICGQNTWCFYCADDTGQLVPVLLRCTERGKHWLRNETDVMNEVVRSVTDHKPIMGGWNCHGSTLATSNAVARVALTAGRS